MADDAISGAESAEPQGQGAEEHSEPKGNSEGYWRRKAEQHERRLREIERAKMSETERLTAEKAESDARATAAEERAQRILKQARFETAAAQAGCVDPEAAFALLGGDALVVGEDGKVQGIKQAIEGLQKSKPYLFRDQPQPKRTGGGNPPGGNGAATINQRMNALLRGQL